MMDGSAPGDEVEPRLSEQLGELWERLKSGRHGSEPFDLTVTDRELDEALAWYADEHSDFPLGEARVSIDSEGVEVSGTARVGTLRLPVRARAGVSLHDGVPLVAVSEVQVGEVGLPDFLRFQLEEQLNRYLALGEDELPVVIQQLELGDGWLTMRGSIR
jgi:hypothetical protein